MQLDRSFNKRSGFMAFLPRLGLRSHATGASRHGQQVAVGCGMSRKDSCLLPASIVGSGFVPLSMIHFKLSAVICVGRVHESVWRNMLGVQAFASLYIRFVAGTSRESASRLQYYVLAHRQGCRSVVAASGNVRQ